MAQRYGLAFLMTLVKRGLAGVIEKGQQQKKGEKKMLGNLIKRTKNGKLKDHLSNTERKSNGKEEGFNTETTTDSTITSSIDMVNQPPHYASSKIECIEAMEAMTSQGRQFKVKLTAHGMYCWQVIFKYIWRFPYKDKPIEDLKKARYYLDRLIKTMEKEK